MITLTPGAAAEIRRAAARAKEAAVLRVAARRLADGRIDYGMGFDEWRTGDIRVLCEGVAVVIAPPSRELLAGVVLDYVEIAPGDSRFVFAAPGQEAEPLRRPAP
jgi:iron-sulfur cluster assembly protein